MKSAFTSIRHSQLSAWAMFCLETTSPCLMDESNTEFPREIANKGFKGSSLPHLGVYCEISARFAQRPLSSFGVSTVIFTFHDSHNPQLAAHPWRRSKRACVTTKRRQDRAVPELGPSPSSPAQDQPSTLGRFPHPFHLRPRAPVNCQLGTPGTPSLRVVDSFIHIHNSRPFVAVNATRLRGPQVVRHNHHPV